MLKLLPVDIQDKVYDFLDYHLLHNNLHKCIEQYFFDSHRRELVETIYKNINSQETTNSLIRAVNMVVKSVWFYDISYIKLRCIRCIRLDLGFRILNRDDNQEHIGREVFKIDVKTTTELENEGLGELMSWSNYGILIADIDYNFYLAVASWILDAVGGDEDDEHDEDEEHDEDDE